MITISGFCCRMTSSMTSRFVSHNRATSSPNSPILVARSLICFRDSSPDMYRTFCFLTERFRHTCRSSVDFPIPGSPPTRIKEPGIIPPPSTRSSSSMPVVVRSSLLIEISFNLAGSVTARDFRTAAPPFFTTGSSVNVFHSRQPGHCPSHFGDSYPHSLQKNTFPFVFKSKILPDIHNKNIELPDIHRMSCRNTILLFANIYILPIPQKFYKRYKYKKPQALYISAIVLPVQP